MLEIGAGSGRFNQNHFDLRGKVARYVGVDPDSSVLKNSYLNEAYQCAADSMPFPGGSFDVVFHYYVAEHFKDPMACHREIARVLKAGFCCFKPRAATGTACWPPKSLRSDFTNSMCVISLPAALKAKYSNLLQIQ